MRTYPDRSFCRGCVVKKTMIFGCGTAQGMSLVIGSARGYLPAARSGSTWPLHRRRDQICDVAGPAVVASIADPESRAKPLTTRFAQRLRYTSSNMARETLGSPPAGMATIRDKIGPLTLDPLHHGDDVGVPITTEKKTTNWSDAPVPPCFAFSKPVSEGLIRELAFENGYSRAKSPAKSRGLS